MATLRQRLLAEMLGTFMLVAATTGSAAAGAGLIGNALANGLMLSMLVAAFAGISGAHFNPAVTIAFAVARRFAWREVLPYILTQLLAASLAAAAVAALYTQHGAGTSQSAEPATAKAVLAPGAGLPSTPTSAALPVAAGEALLTFMLMIAIYGTMIDRRGAAGDGTTAKIGGLGVGFVVAANILLLGPVTGGSMNPARSFGPALVRGEFGLHGCYWAGPVLGAVAGALLYEKFLLGPNRDPEGA